MATKTATVGLNQYVGTDYVRMADFNEDNRLIDEAFKEDRAKLKSLESNIGGMELVDTKVRITDAHEHFTGTTLDKVLDELKTDVSSISTTASGTSYTDTTTQIGATNVQQALEWAVREIKELKQEVTGQTTRLAGINTELETEIGNLV